MYPHERSLVEEMKDKPFVLLGVNSDEKVDVATKAVQRNGLNWRSFQNQEAGRVRAIADDWGVRSWPTIVVMDQELVIRYRGHDGDAATAVARTLVAKLAQK